MYSMHWLSAAFDGERKQVPGTARLSKPVGVPALSGTQRISEDNRTRIKVICDVDWGSASLV